MTVRLAIKAEMVGPHRTRSRPPSQRNGGVVVSPQARLPRNPGARETETPRDFPPNPACRRPVAGSTRYRKPKTRDRSRFAPPRQPWRNVGQNAKTPPRSLGGVP